MIQATATFQDAYFTDAAMRLRRVGRDDRWVWESAEGKCVTTGYRPMPLARALAVARNDRRFSELKTD